MRFKQRDYDLNIYRPELESNDPDKTRYSSVWYLQVFEWVDGTNFQRSEPIKLTPEERTLLDLGNGYFNEEDHWYGLEGFIKDYGHLLTKRLIKTFNFLP